MQRGGRRSPQEPGGLGGAVGGGLKSGKQPKRKKNWTRVQVFMRDASKMFGSGVFTRLTGDEGKAGKALHFQLGVGGRYRRGRDFQPSPAQGVRRRWWGSRLDSPALGP